MNQKGNALFLILIAVALFAALSYAITTSGRGGGTMDRETSLINGAELIQYAGQIQQAVQRMRLANRCLETELSFNDTKWGHADYQHAPVIANDCRVFNISGGGVPFPQVSSDITSLPWEFEGGNRIEGVGTDTGTADKDLIMYLPGVTLRICNAINRGLGLGFASPPVDNGDIVDVVATNRFKGSYVGGAGFDSITGDSTSDCVIASPLCGRQSACFQESAGNQYYVFYNVIIAR